MKGLVCSVCGEPVSADYKVGDSTACPQDPDRRSRAVVPPSMEASAQVREEALADAEVDR